MQPSNANNDFSLDGKAALVIGAERAVGRAAARTLAEAGANLVVASQQPGAEDRIDQAVRAVQAAGRKAIGRVLNAASRADLGAAVDLAVRQLGGLDILVTALDRPCYGPAEAAGDALFDSVLESNFKTVWMACQEAGRAMLQRGGGAIVNLTSVLAQRGVPNAALYCAAKAAVLNLTRALALEWARRNIRVNAIEAGWLEEETSPAARDEEFRRTLLKYLPYNRLVKPEELGGALLYLVSPAAAFVTGESIVVDGGLLCRV